MKAKCMGEFSFEQDDICPCCILGEDTDCLCGGIDDGIYQKKITVPWDTCKTIYKAMLACSPVAAENAALKEENVLLHAHGSELESQIATLKARVAELEAQKVRIKSAGTRMSNICYNMSQWSERLPDGQANVLRDAYKQWDAAIKGPANEG
jgi:hypothetical protein